jgi:hypothetical protein
MQPLRVKIRRCVAEVALRTTSQATPLASKDILDSVLQAMRIAAFYDVHKSHMVMPKDATQILRQMQSQIVFTCEIDRPEAEGRVQIVGAGVLWDREWPTINSSGDIEVCRFLEAGSQRVCLNGYNLQWSLNALTLITTLVSDPAGIYFAATYGDNAPSIGNFLNNMKFKEWNDVPRTLSTWRMHDLKVHHQEARGVRWFRPSAATVIAAAERIVAAADTPLMRSDKGTLLSAANGKPEQQVPAIELEYDPSVSKHILQSCRDIIKSKPRDAAELARIVDPASEKTVGLIRNFLHA